MASVSDELSVLISSAGLIFLGGILSSGSQLIERVIIGRVLSVEAYGEVSVALAIVTLSSAVAMFGFQKGIPRYMTRFDASEEIRGVWVTGITIGLGLAVGGSVILIGGSDLIISYAFDNSESNTLLTVFAISLPFIVGLRLVVAGIQGRENTLSRTITHDILFPGGRIVLLFLFLAIGWGIMAAAYAYLIASLVAFLVGLWFLHQLIPLLGPVQFHGRELLTFSAPLVLSSILWILLTRTDTILIGVFRSSYDVGLYSTAYPLANGLVVVLMSFGYLYLPIASRLDVNDRRKELEEVYQLTTKWIYIITFPALLAFVAFPSDVIRIFFGPEYTAAAGTLIILSLGFFTNAAVGRNMGTLSALGHTQYVLAGNLLAFIINILLNIILIPTVGIVGAALASAIAFTLQNIVIYFVLDRKFDITPFSIASIRSFVLLPLLLFPLSLISSQWISLTAISLPLFLVLTGVISLVIVFFGGGLEPHDRIPLEMLENTLGYNLNVIKNRIPEK